MGVVIVLILFSLLVAVGFLGAFLWAARNGQYDDDVSPAIRMLFENQVQEKEKQSNNEPTQQ